MILSTIYTVISYVIWIYSLLLVIDAITSWLPFLANSVLGQFLNKIINPYLKLFRRGLIERLAFSTGIDVSPILGIFVLYFIQNYVLRWIFDIIIRLMGY